MFVLPAHCTLRTRYSFTISFRTFSQYILETCVIFSVSFPHYLYATDLPPNTQGLPSYDVLLQPPEPITTAAVDAADGRELTGLSASDLSPLQPFELEDAADGNRQGVGVAPEEVSQMAEKLKDRGNTLFKLGDTDAAAEMFTRVLRTLEQTPVPG